MGLIGAKQYFISIMDGLKFHRHKDAFNVNNIPKTKLNKGYHVGYGGPIDPVGQNQNALELNVEVVVNYYIKGKKNTDEVADKGINYMNDIFLETFKASNRVGNSYGVKNVKLTTASLNELSDSNDNSMFGEMIFNCIIILNTL